MGKRRMRGLIVVGGLLWLLGLATLWFIGGWPNLAPTSNGTPPLDARPNAFGMLVALFIATMGCCGLALVLSGIAGLLLLLPRTRD